MPSKAPIPAPAPLLVLEIPLPSNKSLSELRNRLLPQETPAERCGMKHAGKCGMPLLLRRQRTKQPLRLPVKVPYAPWKKPIRCYPR
jgi:hypothetical protein